MSYHITLYHIILYHIISYHIISYHIISYHIIFIKIESNRIESSSFTCIQLYLFIYVCRRQTNESHILYDIKVVTKLNYHAYSRTVLELIFPRIFGHSKFEDPLLHFSHLCCLHHLCLAHLLHHLPNYDQMLQCENRWVVPLTLVQKILPTLIPMTAPLHSIESALPLRGRVSSIDCRIIQILSSAAFTINFC